MQILVSFKLNNTMANSVKPDGLLRAVSSGSALFSNVYLLSARLKRLTSPTNIRFVLIHINWRCLYVTQLPGSVKI